MTATPEPSFSAAKIRSLARRLLAWYDHAHRVMPWRALQGTKPDPYRVWLAEVMLQQTTVAAVTPYFERFLARFPTIEALAGANLDDVLHAWQGLGYYARARNLHKCAGVVCRAFGGRLPDTEAALLALPGIGAYTAAAVAAIAFDRKAMPVDGNVERVMSRLFAITEPMPASKPVLRRHAALFASAHRPGDLAQAMMDLGATVCTPRAPRCEICPWQGDCRAFAGGLAADLPKRSRMPKRPRRFGVAYWVERGGDGAILLRRRAEKGLLAGMMEIPCTNFRTEPWGKAEADRAAPLALNWRELPGTVRHVFTHFDLAVTVRVAKANARSAAEGTWCRPDEWSAYALPSLMKKIIRHARQAEGDATIRPPIPSRPAASGAARRSRRMSRS